MDYVSDGILELEFDRDGASSFEDADGAVCPAGLGVSGVVDGLKEAVEAVDYFVGDGLGFGVSCFVGCGDGEVVGSDGACIDSGSGGNGAIGCRDA